MTNSNLHVIVGLGASGFSCANYLAKCGIPIAITDTRSDPPYLAALQKTYPDVVVSLGKLDENLLASAAKIIISPGVSLNQIHVPKTIPIIGDIELFAQTNKAPVIAITGTNAKSTVTTLVNQMALAAGHRSNAGGNLGMPALDLWANHPNADLFVLELSSFQLETTYSLKSEVAVVLNITPDHMDRYTNLAEYQQAKHRVYDRCKIAVCNRDDALTECRSLPASHKLYFTLGKPQQNEFGLLTKDNELYLAYEDKPLIPVSALPIRGRHYHANALAALAIGYGFGLNFEPMLTALREFKGLPHRCELVRKRNGVEWYNDSKGTNVGASMAAILGLGSELQGGKLILIAGGISKKADFSPLLPSIEKYVRAAILIGEAAPDLAATMGHSIDIAFANSMEEAVSKADHAAQTGDSVLLSPACASFDMFRNYEHRGQVFAQSVLKLV